MSAALIGSQLPGVFLRTYASPAHAEASAPELYRISCAFFDSERGLHPERFNWGKTYKSIKSARQALKAFKESHPPDKWTMTVGCHKPTGFVEKKSRLCNFQIEHHYSKTSHEQAL